MCLPARTQRTYPPPRPQGAHFPTSPNVSLDLLIPPHIFPYLPPSPHISPHLPHLLPPLTFVPLLHRALQPPNVLHDEKGKCKLCDFGTAIELAPAAPLPTEWMGSQLYVAPEVRSQELEAHSLQLRL